MIVPLTGPCCLTLSRMQHGVNCPLPSTNTTAYVFSPRITKVGYPVSAVSESFDLRPNGALEMIGAESTVHRITSAVSGVRSTHPKPSRPRTSSQEAESTLVTGRKNYTQQSVNNRLVRSRHSQIGPHTTYAFLTAEIFKGSCVPLCSSPRTKGTSIPGLALLI